MIVTAPEALRFRSLRFRRMRILSLLPAAAIALLSACSRDEPQPSVANASEAIVANLQARADALELQARNAAEADLAEMVGNQADALDAPLANSGEAGGAPSR